MSDPEIIKSSTPHRVSIPEGSSNAVGKKAEVGEASIRKSLHDASEETNDITIDDHALKGKNAPLSLDEEIAAAKAALLKKKDLQVAKEALTSDDELRAKKEGVAANKDLRAEKEGFGPVGDLRAEKAGVVPAGDLRAEKEGVEPSGDLKAPKEAVATGGDLKAPKVEAKADEELRAPKEAIKSNPVAALASSDPLAKISPGTSAPSTQTTAKPDDTAKDKEPTEVSALAASPAEVAASQIQPEMDFPARVVHLKIENDNLRSTLDKLESAP
jgi:hypothetical protein